MRVRVITGILACLALAAVSAGEVRQGASGAPKHEIVPADKVAFAPIDVPGFKPGMNIAVVHGNPDAESGTYVVRLKFPDGYTFPPHWHPMAENVTVLSGTFMLGMGEKVDASGVAAYSPGAFLHIPGKMAHFGGAKGTTIIQLHGQAPFKIELVKQ